MIRVPAPPEMLRWACERAGRDVADVSERVPQLRTWIRSERQPTLQQLKLLAKITHTLLGYLFLREPPDESLSVPDYRTVSGTATAKPSPDLLKTLYTMQRRQAWLRDSLAEHEAETLAFVGSARLADEPATRCGAPSTGPVAGEDCRTLLDCGRTTGAPPSETPYTMLRKML